VQLVRLDQVFGLFSGAIDLLIERLWQACQIGDYEPAVGPPGAGLDTGDDAALDLPGCRDALVQAMGMSGISKSQVSRLCGEIDDKVAAFLNRPLEGEWPYLWLDATYVKVREQGRIVSVAVIVAVAVNGDGPWAFSPRA
jgi:hypothetical protein